MEKQENKQEVEFKEVKEPLYKEEKEFKSDEDIEAVIEPNHFYSQIAKFVNSVDTEALDKLPEKDRIAIAILADSVRTSVKNDVFKKAILSKENWLNKPEYGEKDLVIRDLELKAKPGKEIKGKTALLKIRKKTKRGGLIQVPLWHSGFWITLQPISESSLINLELELSNNFQQLGRDTQSLVFSNRQVIYNRIITDFFLDNLYDTTVQLSKKDDIRKLIKMQDLNIILLALVTSMYPNGYTLLRSCKNAIKLDENTKPTCNFVLEATLDPRKMLWVNKEDLTKEQLEHMTKRAPASMKIDEVIEYQKSLSCNREVLIDVKDVDGEKAYSVKIATPSLYDHILEGESWVNEVIEKTEESLTEDASDEQKDEIIDNISRVLILGLYKHYVKEITTVDDEIIKDRDTIKMLLNDISEDPVEYNQILKAITEYISRNVIAIPGIPVYECPNCKEVQTGSNVKGLEQIIPVNMLENFFNLRTFKLAKILEKIQNAKDI